MSHPKKLPEVKYCGFHACQAVISQRRDAIVRAYVVKERLKDFKTFLAWCAQTKRAYHVVTAEDLELVMGSKHHQGIGLLLREAPALDLDELLRARQANPEIPRVVIYLDGTNNPHNVGAIFRTAAHFGASAILGEEPGFPRISGSLARISEGGCETIPVVRSTDMAGALRSLKSAGFKIYGLHGKAKASIFNARLNSASVLVLGNEVSGIRPETLALCDEQLKIPGTNWVESLNVSVACGIAIGAWAQSVALGPKR